MKWLGVIAAGSCQPGQKSSWIPPCLLLHKGNSSCKLIPCSPGIKSLSGCSCHKLSQSWVHRVPQWHILMTKAKWSFLALAGSVTCTIFTNNSVHTQIWVPPSSFSLPKGFCAFLVISSCLDALLYTHPPLHKHSSHCQDHTQKPALLALFD